MHKRRRTRKKCINKNQMEKKERKQENNVNDIRTRRASLMTKLNLWNYSMARTKILLVFVEIKACTS